MAAALFRRALSFPKENPITFGVGFSTVKTSGADLLVQTTVEKKEWADIDWKRNTAFALFGFFYLGGVQYAIYVPGFGRLFPNAATFAAKPLVEKVKDPRGCFNMLSQVFLDQCVHHPFLYFPVFYSLKEVVAGHTAVEGLMKYKDNFTEDLVALWKVWVPATIVNFTFCPMWMRIPFVASTSLIWTFILSSMRGANDIEEAEDASDMLLNQGYALQRLIESPKLDPKLDHLLVSCHGPDRVGLLHTFAQACHSHDASISESKMVRMGGQFMIMMVVSVEPSTTASFQAMLQQDLGNDVIVNCENMSTETRSLANISRSTTSARAGQVAYLHVQGDDRAGIVADVTRLLSSHSMNIERMETTVKPSHHSKPSVFEIKGMVQSHGPMEPAALLAAARHLEEELKKSGQAVKISIEFKGSAIIKK